MEKNFLNRIMKGVMIVVMTLFLQTPLRAQLDSISISGTIIDTTKVYDGTTIANIVTVGEYPLLPYSQVLINAEAHYLDPAVGNDKPVVVTFSVTGPDAFHYQTPASIILSADITPRELTADSVVLQSFREYDGTTVCQVLSDGVLNGILPGDTVGQTVTAYHSTPFASPFIRTVTVTHTLTGPQSGNYFVTDTNIYRSTINPRTVTATKDYLIKYIKEYDGSDSAQVLEQPTLENTIAGDDIDVYVEAHFDSPEVGDEKTIYTYHHLTGSESNNYSLVADSTYYLKGRIVLPIILDPVDGERFIASSAYGYCQDEQVVLRYRLRQGEPRYRIFFSEEAQAAGFYFDTNAWVAPSADDSLIVFPVPAGCPAGRYSAAVEMRNPADNAILLPCTFAIDMPNSYLVQTFDDVISIDNSGRLDGQPNRFHSFQWLHNDVAIPNANKPYYQEAGGLDGKYAVMVNMGSEDEAMICPLFFTPAGKATVQLMPSPVSTTTTVRLHGFADGQHQLQVFNSHGVAVYAIPFEGTQHLLDLSALPQGTYLITVDGHSTKTLKL